MVIPDLQGYCDNEMCVKCLPWSRCFINVRSSVLCALSQGGVGRRRYERLEYLTIFLGNLFSWGRLSLLWHLWKLIAQIWCLIQRHMCGPDAPLSQFSHHPNDLPFLPAALLYLPQSIGDLEHRTRAKRTWRKLKFPSQPEPSI